jgi:uncharacterized protein
LIALLLLQSAHERASSRQNGRVTRAVLQVVDGKALYNGRRLAEWVPDVAQRIFECSAAERVILFGSVARGDDNPDSDIDVIVVLPITGSRHDVGVQLSRELSEMPVPVDVMVVDSEAFPTEARLPGIVRVAVREGRVFERAA